jgi:lipid-A-disaccharide synthase
VVRDLQKGFVVDKSVGEQRRIMVVTGEASGDLHGAHLIEAARQMDPGVRFYGVGGKRMAEAGCENVFPSDELAVMGLVEVFGHLPRLYRAFRRLKKLLIGPDRPDVLVLIDFQEFNQRLARVAKKAGIPVLFFVGPTVWAWRPGRVKTMARSVDRLAVIFPFEPEYYRAEDLLVEYVGHPLLDELQSISENGDTRCDFNLDPARPVVGLFPGSRKSELKYNFPTMIAAAQRIYQQIPAVQFLLPVAPTFQRAEFHKLLQESRLSVHLTEGNIYDVARACDAVLSVSGTVTLQVALVGTPMAIMYKMPALNFAIGRRLIKAPFIGLPNIVAGREVVQEFIQDQATADNLAGEIVRVLNDKNYRQSMSQQLFEVRQEMGQAGCAQRVARMVLQMAYPSS